MFSHSNRSFWSVFSILFLVLVMGFSAFMAVRQAGLLRDANINIQRQLVPFSRGIVELESNLTALRASTNLLRSQSENNEADPVELLRAHNYMAHILDEMVALAALDLSDAQHVALQGLQSQVTRFQRSYDDFSALLNAAKYDKAVEQYDGVLTERSDLFALQVSDFIGFNRRLQANSIDAAVAAYNTAYWTILGSVGAALVASLLIAGGRGRPAWRRQRQSAGAARTALG